MLPCSDKKFNEISVRITKITNNLSAHDTQIFNVEFGKIYANKLTAKIRKIKTHDDGFNKEVQKILLMVSNITARLNTIEEACCNNFGRFIADFTSINASVEALQIIMLLFKESKLIS